MTTYYMKLKGTSLCHSNRAEVGDDNANVANWSKTNKFIYCVAIGQDSRDTANGAYVLRWRVANGTYANLGATGAMKYTNQTDLTDGNAVASAEAKVAVANMTWADGEEIEDGGSNAANYGSDVYSELQFAVDPADAAASALYEFLLYNITSGANVAVESGAYLTVQIAANVTLANAAGTMPAPSGTVTRRLQAKRSIGGTL